MEVKNINSHIMNLYKYNILHILKNSFDLEYEYGIVAAENKEDAEKYVREDLNFSGSIGIHDLHLKVLIPNDEFNEDTHYRIKICSYADML